MYAVIKTSGKQYRVSDNDIITIEKLNKEVGDKVSFDEVLMIGGETVSVGSPFIKGAKVEAEIINNYRGKKIHIIKFKRRKHHIKRQGHRQLYTKVKINKINAGG